jgi:hypothetical protein
MRRFLGMWLKVFAGCLVFVGVGHLLIAAFGGNVVVTQNSATVDVILCVVFGLVVAIVGWSNS